ncbi:MAG: hypothetical protein LBT69_03605 [Lactobacillales bacterium]|jgi:hypothetical protein|nr:hypothetical protein [Lactobacillales bacterium]
MNSKEKYVQICESDKGKQIPIFSKYWWMDTVCGSDNWDVWIYEKSGTVFAVMPYYWEQRGKYKYITRPVLTQNNGIIFFYPSNQKYTRRLSFEEEIINSAVEFIDNLDVDVYEQQYRYTFDNFVPFYWNNFSALTRYTFVIEDTTDIEKIFNNFDSKMKNCVRKGRKETSVFIDDISIDDFYSEHKKIYLKQSMECPISYDLWFRLYRVCKEYNCCKILCARDNNDNVHSILFMIWDSESVYLLLGGSMPQFSWSNSYSMLIFESIKMASKMGLAYDFEGSVISKINRSYREFGGIQKSYFRVRKVYNPEIVIQEANEYIEKISR